MHQLITIVLIVGTIGSVISLLACLFYPLAKKMGSKQKELRRISLTVDGKTIDAQIPPEKVEQLLSILRKYQSDDSILSTGLRC